MKFTPGSFQKIRSHPPWRVLFFGTDEFSLGTLKALHENSLLTGSGKSLVETLHVVLPKTKKPSPVAKYAAFCGMMGYEWPVVNLGKQPNYDVGVLASFGHLIPQKLLEEFPYGILNVHPSLLPRWRGAAPLHHTILNGDKRTGVTIMSIKPKHFDVGPILAQKEFDLPQTFWMTRLRDYLSDEGGKMIIDVLSRLPEAVIEETLQSDEGATYAHKIALPMSFIDWSSQTASAIDRQYRALHETNELRTVWEGTTVQMLDMADRDKKPDVSLESSSPPGLPVYDKYNNVIWVRCKDTWVAFENIVIRKKMSAKSFYNGYLSKKHLQGVTFKSIANNLFDDHYEQWIRQRRPS